MQLQETDEHTTYMQQLQEAGGDGPIVLINRFSVAPEDADKLVAAWTADAAFMRDQPGFITTQFHRGTAGSGTFVNVAEWESVDALRAAFTSPEFQRGLGRYPEGTVASPHVFEQV